MNLRFYLVVCIALAQGILVFAASKKNQASATTQNTVPETQRQTAANPPDSGLLTFQTTLLGQQKSYQEFLQKETERHQAFIEKLYSMAAAAFTGAVTLFLGIIGFINYRTTKDVEKHVKTQFTDKVQSEVSKQLHEFKEKSESHLSTIQNQTQSHLLSFQNHIESTKQLINTKADEIREVTNKEFEFITEYVNIIGHAAVVLSFSRDKDESEKASRNRLRLEVAGRLMKLQQRVPCHRTIAIFIGRLFREMGEFDKAVAALDRVINERTAKGMVNDSDQAALLFNKACYSNLRAGQLGGDGAAMRIVAWEALRQSVKIYPQNYDQAVSDSDLNGLPEAVGKSWESLKT